MSKNPENYDENDRPGNWESRNSLRKVTSQKKESKIKKALKKIQSFFTSKGFSENLKIK